MYVGGNRRWVPLTIEYHMSAQVLDQLVDRASQLKKSA